MPLLTAPKSFVEKLQRYDRALRVVWSDARACWLIQRKIGPARPSLPGAFPDQDEYLAARDGYTILFEVDRECLDARVLTSLWDSDIWRQGGADVVNERIDQAYASAQRQGREEFLDFVRQEARARWRYMHRPRTLKESEVHTAPEGGMF